MESGNKEDILHSDNELAPVLRELIMGMAHDVRNPLSAAQCSLSLLDLRLDKPEQKEHLKQISTQVEYASMVLTAFGGIFKPVCEVCEAIDIGHVCHEVLTIYRSMAIVRGIDLTAEYADIPDQCIDKGAFSQILINFIKNALDACTKGDRVILSLLEGEHTITVQVADSGKGMDEGQLAHIFDAHYTTKAHGMGLGLNICQHIAHTHDWEIKVESKLGSGSVFSLIIPAKSDKIGQELK